MKRILKMGSALLFAVALPVSAQTEWTLQDCIDYAIGHNITLQRNRASAASADIDRREASAAFLPSLSASLSEQVNYRPFSSSGSNIVNGGIATSAAKKATLSGSYGVDVRWTVWDGGKRTNRLRSAEMAQQRADLATQVTENELREEILRLYVQILYTREAEAVNRSLLEMDSLLLERGKVMQEEGTLARADVAQLSAQVSQGRYEWVNTRTLIEGYTTQLRQLLMLPADTTLVLSSRPADDAVARSPLPAVAEIFAAALDSRPEVKSGKLAVEQSRIDTKAARAGYWPSVSLNGSIGDSHISGGRDSFLGQMKSNFNTVVGVSVSIPLFDNRSTRSAVERARVAEVTADLDLVDTQRQLYTTIESCWQQAVSSREKYMAAADNAAAVQESYSLLTERFSLGLKNISDLLAGRASLLEARQNLLQDKYTTLLNRTLLQFYASGNIDED